MFNGHTHFLNKGNVIFHAMSPIRHRERVFPARPIESSRIWHHLTSFLFEIWLWKPPDFKFGARWVPTLPCFTFRSHFYHFESPYIPYWVKNANIRIWRHCRNIARFQNSTFILLKTILQINLVIQRTLKRLFEFEDLITVLPDFKIRLKVFQKSIKIRLINLKTIL